jgi:hypothetical protein
LGWSAVAVVEGLHLLKLVGRKDGCKLLSRLLMYCVHLLLRDHRGDCGIAFQRGDLLVAVGQDGFELRGLVGGEV